MCIAQNAMKVANQPVKADANYERPASDGDVHLLIMALDYKQTDNPLTCSMDGRNMEVLAQACGVSDMVVMYNEQCTKEAVLQAISEVGSRVTEDDYFIIYYSGHGTSINDEDGDEDDGKDEAFCFVDANGQISMDTLLTDDDFAEAVCDATDDSPSARILILTDCCHSGTIADLDKDCWAEREAISITGCLDSETSGDMGKGGIFTHSLLLAVDQLSEAEQEEYSIGMVYNACLENDNKIFNSAQNITIQSSAAISPDKMAWPLIPSAGYKAPLSQATTASGDAEGVSSLNPQLLAQLGINPQVAGLIQSSGIIDQIVAGKIDPEKLAATGLKLFMSGACKKDNCAVM